LHLTAPTLLLMNCNSNCNMICLLLHSFSQVHA
jgi:hypothetical protein